MVTHWGVSVLAIRKAGSYNNGVGSGVCGGGGGVTGVIY